MARAKKVTEPVITETETAPQTEVVESPPVTHEPGVKEQREALKAAGFKRCPGHAQYLDRLPEAVRQPVAGYDDPSIRPLAEFGGMSSCKQCVKLRNADHRGTNPTNTERLTERLQRLVQRQQDITRKIEGVQALLQVQE